MTINFEKFLNNAVDGIFIVSKNGDLILFNQACEELYELSREDLVNTAFLKFSDLGDIEKDVLKKNDKNPFSEIQSKKERFFLSRKNGDSVWVEANYIPIMDHKHNEIAYVLGIFKDLTEFKELERENKNLRLELEEIRRGLEQNFDFSNIIGNSPEITKSLELASKVSKEDTTVILLGESGTGKEIFARAIHANSARSRGPFVAINCSAFPDTLIESELFGYEKGAFTGADGSKKGKVGQAEGGTLFLDEITELSAPAQAKILRLVQENEYQPLGSSKILKANIRFISATNQDIKALVNEGAFREDLYYRFFVYPIFIPALKDRKQDIPILAKYYMEKLCANSGKRVLSIPDKTMAILMEYSWPGNVRELQNVLERAIILCKGKYIEEDDLPIQLKPEHLPESHLFSLDSLPKGISLEKHKEQWEKKIIMNTLKECGHNKAKTARVLGLTRSALRYKLQKMMKE